MKTANFILCAVLCIVGVFVSSCSITDWLAGTREEQATNDQGAPLYQAPDGEETTQPVDPATGIPNAPVTKTVVTGENAEIASGVLASIFGPWGALAGTAVVAGAGWYARWRNGQKTKLNEAAATFAIQLIEKVKRGEAIDADKDGKISLNELEVWIRKQGKPFTDPVYLAELVRQANKALAA